jgi:hypothetical protein
LIGSIVVSRPMVVRVNIGSLLFNVRFAVSSTQNRRCRFGRLQLLRTSHHQYLAYRFLFPDSKVV